jgi:hypothetical protein
MSVERVFALMNQEGFLELVERYHEAQAAVAGALAGNEPYAAAQDGLRDAWREITGLARKERVSAGELALLSVWDPDGPEAAALVSTLASAARHESAVARPRAS